MLKGLIRRKTNFKMLVDYANLNEVLRILNDLKVAYKIHKTDATHADTWAIDMGHIRKATMIEINKRVVPKARNTTFIYC